MSLKRLLSVHQVTVLVQNPVLGPGLGVARNYAPAGTPVVLNCRVEPISGDAQLQLLIRGMDISHRITFPADPQIDERNRLQWNGVGNNTIFRLVTLPMNQHGQQRKWECLVIAKTEDNRTVEVE